jgi:hypothetical protein
MPVRVRYNITYSISSTPAEERDLANPQYEVVTDSQQDGGITKTLVAAGQQNVPLNILNLADAGFLVIRINSRDPTLPPNAIVIGINSPGEVQIATLPLPPFVYVLTASNTSGTVTTITTATPHGLMVGQVILIAGNSNSVFNASFTITTVPSATTFTFNQVVGSPPQTGTSGTVQALVYGIANPLGTVTTITTTSPHGFSVGDMIVVFGTSNDPVFSGVFTVTAIPTTTMFTYNQTFLSFPQYGNGGTAQILGASEVTIAPLGDATEGHLLLSTQGSITELYASNPGTTNMDVTVAVAGPLP